MWDLSSSTDALYKNNITLFSPKIGTRTHITFNDINTAIPNWLEYAMRTQILEQMLDFTIYLKNADNIETHEELKLLNAFRDDDDIACSPQLYCGASTRKQCFEPTLCMIV